MALSILLQTTQGFTELSKFQKIPAGSKMSLCFEVLSGSKSAVSLVGRTKKFSQMDALFVDQECN